MRKQNGEVQRTRKALSRKTCGAVLEVIGEIRAEKSYRNDERGDLAGTMCGDVSLADKNITRQQQNKTRGIENCVEVRQIGNVFRHSASLNLFRYLFTLFG